MTLGILTLSLPSISSYLKDIVMASHESIGKAVIVLVKDIEFHSSTVRAYTWDDTINQWQQEIIPLPSLWYDRCLYGEDAVSQQGREIVKQLKSNSSHTFLGYGLPDKYKLYQQLRTHPVLHRYLVPTFLLEELFQIEDLLISYDEWIMKPVNGAHGFAVYAIQQKRDGTIRVQTTKNDHLKTVYVPSIDDFYRWFNHLFSQFQWIFQPRIPSITKQKQPIDIRVFLQKDSTGNWMIVQKGVRLGKTNGLLTNLSAGASVITFQEWQKSVPKEIAQRVEHQLQESLTLLPVELEGAFHSLFELGVDILLLPTGDIKILDINSKPGRKILSILSPELYEKQKLAPLLYSNYLVSSKLERS